MTAQLFSFVGACLAIIVVPGPDLALLLRNATTNRHAAGATAAGIMVGNAILAAAAVAGLTALFQGSQVLYNLVRVAGAAYLIYLGAQALVSLARRREASRGEESDSPHTVPTDSRARRRAFRQGLFSNLLNPKVAAFYLALFPQFSLPGLPTSVQHSILAAVFCTLALAWYAVVLVLLARIRAWLYKHRVQQGIAAVSGATLVGLGTSLALHGRS